LVYTSNVAQILEVKAENLAGCLDSPQGTRDRPPKCCAQQNNTAPSSVLPPKAQSKGESHAWLCGRSLLGPIHRNWKTSVSFEEKVNMQRQAPCVCSPLILLSWR